LSCQRADLPAESYPDPVDDLVAHPSPRAEVLRKRCEKAGANDHEQDREPHEGHIAARLGYQRPARQVAADLAKSQRKDPHARQERIVALDGLQIVWSTAESARWSLSCVLQRTCRRR